MKYRSVFGVLLAAALLLSAGRVHALTLAAGADNIAYLPVHQMGYTGKGVITGVIDLMFPNPNHATFYVSADNHASRVTRMSLYGGDAGYGIGHANAVAGVLAGRGKGDGTYLGVAPQAEVWAASCSGDETSIRQAFLDFTSSDAQGRRCQVFVMSLAAFIPDNGVYPFVQFLDWLAVNRGAFLSFGTAQAGGSVAIPGGNYNQLTVGGLDQALQHVSSTSGTGPTPDGRSKPDVVAPSTNLYLPDHTGVDNWYRNPGSYPSVAAPFGAGVAALLRQYGDNHAFTWDVRVIKSVILNSATKLPGWTHTETQPLDNAQGAGRINALRAIYQYAAGKQSPGNVQSAGWDLDNVTNHAMKLYHMTEKVPAGSTVVATLDWFRYTAPIDDNLLGYFWITTKFEDLNLYLYRDSDCALVARSVSAVDSVEHIYYRLAEEDTYTLAVGLLGGGNRIETYGLSWWTEVPEPGSLTLFALGFTAAAGLIRRRTLSARRASPPSSIRI